MNVLYADLCARLPDGQADADAFLAGEPMPSVVRARDEKQAHRQAFATMAGGEIIGGGE